MTRKNEGGDTVRNTATGETTTNWALLTETGDLIRQHHDEIDNISVKKLVPGKWELAPST